MPAPVVRTPTAPVLSNLTLHAPALSSPVSIPQQTVNPFQSPMQAYSQAQNNALAQHQQVYNAVMKGYGNVLSQGASATNAILRGYPQQARQAAAQSKATLAAQERGQQQILGGYGQLESRVTSGLQGAADANAQDIAAAYAKQSGALDQQLISAGLGNSTVRGQMARGPMLDEQRALLTNKNQLQQAIAGYQANIGGQRLGYAGQAIGANTQQSNLGTQMGMSVGLQGLGYAGQAQQAQSYLAAQGLQTLGQLGQPQYPQLGNYAGIYGARQSYGPQGFTSGGGGVGGGGIQAYQFGQPQQFNMAEMNRQGSNYGMGVGAADMFGGSGRQAGAGYTIGQTSPAVVYPAAASNADWEGGGGNWA